MHHISLISFAVLSFDHLLQNYYETVEEVRFGVGSERVVVCGCSFQKFDEDLVSSSKFILRAMLASIKL